MIKVNVHRSWIEDEEELMIRVAGAVCSGGAGAAVRQESGYDWRLDESNDWFAQVRDGQLIVEYRYDDESRMEALRVFLEWSVILGE